MRIFCNSDAFIVLSCAFFCPSLLHLTSFLSQLFNVLLYIRKINIYCLQKRKENSNENYVILWITQLTNALTLPDSEYMHPLANQGW